MKEILFLNGRYMALSKGSISVEDRGFQLGDGIYEVISVYHGRIFACGDHLVRLERSARAVRIKMPYGRRRIREILEELVRRSGKYDGIIYLQLTRGAFRRQHNFPPQGTPPTFLAYSRAVKTGKAGGEGVRVVTMPETRWGCCFIKSTNLLPNILAREEAVRRGADEAVFVGAGGYVVEGAATNIYMVKKGRVFTPREKAGMLTGVTRKHVGALAGSAGIVFEEKDFKAKDLLSADEVFLSGTISEIVPVVSVDGKKIGRGREGRVTGILRGKFREMVERL